MNLRLCVLCLFAANAVAFSQTIPLQPPTPPAGNAATVSVLPDLDRLQAAASQTNLDLGHLRIDKWKADGESKRQAQDNADSLQRNLTSALPGLINSVRNAPEDLSAEFKLYRNLNALYDVLASVTESAGAFGPRSDYEALAQQLETVDSVRHDLANALEQLTSAAQSEMTQLRSQVRSYHQAAAAAPPPKKVVVDDTEPAKKVVHKKKKPSTITSTSAADPSNPNP